MAAAARRASGVVLLACIVAACGNGLDRHKPDAAINPARPVPIPTITSTRADATTAVNRITDGLRTHGLDSQMSDIHVFTTKTDPSHQLGRPHSYVARAAFTDTTLPAAATRSAGLARGGTVEVFTMAADARAAAGHAADELPGETDLLSGVVLLRLSPRAPSTLVETYRTALHETTGTPAQVVR